MLKFSDELLYLTHPLRRLTLLYLDQTKLTEPVPHFLLPS